MINDISQHIEGVLRICDDSVCVTNVEEHPGEIIAYVEKTEKICFCEQCGQKMLSKGPRIRTVNHPIYQDGTTLTLKVETRKWYCRDCNCYCYDSFQFIGKGMQNSNLTILMILDKMKRLDNTLTQIAAELNVSDTYVFETFMRYVDMPRLPLCRVLCMDEVYLHIDNNNLYALVLLNWETGDVIDILPNRYKETIMRYFKAIDIKERDTVEFLVTDMYDTYTQLAGTVFRKAVSVIDCFHHTQPLITRIRNYIISVRKRYLERDRKRLEDENYRNNRNYKTRKDSREVWLLKHQNWILLKNHSDISYEPYYRHIKGRGSYLYNPADLEKEYLALDPKFKTIRDLKEKYIHFTHDHVNDPDGAAQELDQLISEYKASDIALFRDFADILASHRDGIIASFHYLSAERFEDNDQTLHRLSNGPAESYNNDPKDLKRVTNGLSNFPFARNRLLWSARKNPSMLVIPKSRSEIHTEGKKRGPYKKK